MTRTLFDCVGDWFEDIVQLQFPDFKKTGCRDGTRPDFEGSKFDTEAKVGYWDYGAQLKEAQVENFESNGRPIIYIIGYHNAKGLRNTTAHMTEEEIDHHLKGTAGVHSAYVVSNEMIKRIWRKESHVAASNPDWKYFSVRPRHLDAVIHNKSFTRAGTRHMPSRWYGMCRPDFLLQPAPLLRGRTTPLEFGAILHRETDKSVIDYLTKQGLLH